MPKLELKIVQRELDQGQLWPVYWLYGAERMKSRELLRRIRKAVFPESQGAQASSLLGMAEESFDGGETDAAAVVDAAQSLSFGGGLRFIVVRDAHAMKSPERIGELFGERKPRAELQSVCVFLSKDFDQRKKISKQLIEKAAVVPCEEVAEGEREAWIQYLARRRGIELPGEWVARLASLDPWSLDIVDQELEKHSIDPGGAGGFGETFIGGVAPGSGADSFLDAFFSRDLKASLRAVGGFAEHLDEALPLLGLFAWNVRHLALILADQRAGTRVVKLNPYVEGRLRGWARHWSLEESLELQASLQKMDHGLKQTPLMPLGLWSELVTRFCR